MYFSGTRNVDELGDVVVVELEVITLEEMLDVLQAAGDQVVHGDHVVPLLQEAIAESVSRGNRRHR
jgi:hypothetical protein